MAQLRLGVAKRRMNQAPTATSSAMKPIATDRNSATSVGETPVSLSANGWNMTRRKKPFMWKPTAP